MGRERPQLIFPWRIATQIGALVIVIGSLGVSPPVVPLGLLGLLAVAAGIGRSGSTGEQPPCQRLGRISARWTLRVCGVDRAPPFPVRRFAPLAAAAMTAATLLLWAEL